MRLLSWALACAVLLAALLLAGVVAVEWRLSRGPVSLPWAAQWLEARANRDGGRPPLRIGALTLQSAAWRDGPDAPLVLRVTDAAAVEPDAPPLLSLPDASVALALPPLLSGEIRPRVVEAEGVRVRLSRSAEGAIALRRDRSPKPASPTPAAGQAPVRLDDILKALAHPAADTSGNGPLAILGGLRRVSLRDIRADVADDQLGADWQAETSKAEFARPDAGGITGDADLALTLGGETARLALTAKVDTDAASEATLRLEPVNPARWARAAPLLMDAQSLDAPVSGQAGVSLGPDLGIRHFRLQAETGAGKASFAGTAADLLGARMRANGTLDAVVLEQADVTLRGRPESTPTTIGLRGSLIRAAPGLVADGAITLDRVSFADLPLLWPEGVGGNARRWITENIPDGIARDANVAFTVTTPLDFSDVQLTQAKGTLEGEDLTVWWLRPVPPLERGRATLRILDPDTFEIVAYGGRQRPSGARVRDPRAGLILRGGTVRITGIMQPHQIGYIVADIAGPLQDALGLLSEKRLNLLSEHPMPLKDPRGQAAVNLKVNVPLEDAVQIEDIPLRALAHLTDVSLADVVDGMGAERGILDLDVTQEGLSGFGTAVALGIPVTFGADLDFRAGPRSQVLTRVTLEGRGNIAQLAKAGIDARDAMSGVVGLRAQLVQQRDGQGTVEMRADLQDVTLTAAPLAWQKQAGVPASGSARVRLQRDALQAVDDLVLTAPALDMRGHASFAENKPALLRFDTLRIGKSDMTGSVQFPPKPGQGPIAAVVSGPVLDVSAWLSGGQTGPGRKAPRSSPEPENTPWSIDARFDRVLTGRGPDLAGVILVAENDGKFLRRLHAEGQAGAGAALCADIVPDGAVRRRLNVAASDVGVLLQSLGLTGGVSGGVLTVDGVYDDARADHRLTAQASMGPFRITDAPFAAKLLKALTIYGIADLLRGPGIGVSEVVAPFTMANQVLDLGNSRAVSPSLGVTANGRIDMRTDVADLRGTVVPAYFFNSLPGRIPFIGHLFTAERGGGLIAAEFTVKGPLDNPSVSVNPLSLLAPGALRKLFE